MRLQGVNVSKHATPYREETFGLPGSRIRGKPTCWNVLLLPLQPHWSAGLERSSPRRIALEKLAVFLRVKLSEDRSYVEAVQVVEQGGERKLRVDHRFPIDEDQTSLEKDIGVTVSEWFHLCLAKGTADGLDG